MSDTQLFVDLYSILMKVKFMKMATPEFGKNPQLAKVKSLVANGALHLPDPFRTAYSDPLENRLAGLFARLKGQDDMLESLTGAVYQHVPDVHTDDLHRFLAVISNLYRSFLDKSKREALNLPLLETMPPLAVFQSDPGGGPFTITVEQVQSLVGGSVGVVSLPLTFAGHPYLYASLAHETGGHDVTHANVKLLPEIRAGVYSLFAGSNAWQGVLWDYWMDEVVSDVYGLLNVGPSFGANLAMLLSVFIAQAGKTNDATPKMRTTSGPDEQGYLDPHPTDILRLSLAQGVISSLKGLTPAVGKRYNSQLDGLIALLAPNATTIELQGFARVSSGRSINFNDSYSLDDMQLSARNVGAYIANSAFDALAGHSIQDIETWDDGDESAAAHIASALLGGRSIVSAGDDAQIIAGLTLALMQQPAKYKEFTAATNSALDQSFASDPYWALPSKEKYIFKSWRTLPKSEPAVDPYAVRIIDFNPLEDDPFGGTLSPQELVERHAITPIPWPNQQVAPKIVQMPGNITADSELPKCDYVFVTYTTAEANAMSAVLTPGFLAVPPSGFTGTNKWYSYAHKYDSYVPNLRRGSSPALLSKDLGKYFLISISGKKTLCFKTSLHLARDGQELPVKDLLKQIAEETGAKLIITTGTAGAIGPDLILGDTVIATSARFDCMKMFKNASFNNQLYTSTYTLANSSFVDVANSLIPANSHQLPASNRAPKIFTGVTVLGEANTIVTTDKFAYDDSGDKFQLQGKGSMVEMGDAVLPLACQELKEKGITPPDWLVIRNASDPQVSASMNEAQASKIYEQYGYWTAINSVLASWAVVA